MIKYRYIIFSQYFNFKLLYAVNATVQGTNNYKS